ncbi:hypothetical protein [Candidatus Azobacteroides pseudotrichonymphae]|nr:hypothetical protein [Candidatus Azobacteroides pseudotrichonymphae]
MNTLLLDLSKGEGFEDERGRTILEVFYSTGIRCSELVGLNDERY